MSVATHIIIFFGTTEHSALMLSKLLEMKDVSVPLIVTKKGKPAGRGLGVEPSPVALFGKEHAIPVIEVEKTRETIKELKMVKPELFFVVDFGKIIPQDVLDIPTKGTMNFHPSLLSAYRGPSPIVTPILNGNKETGFSYMLLDAQMDHGPTLYQETVSIAPNDTAGSLENTLFEKGAEKFGKIISEYLSGVLRPVAQNHSEATITKLIQKEDALVDFSKESADVIERKVRAYNPWPYAFFFHNGKRIQIIKAKMTQGINASMHQFIKTNEGIVASCANNTFLLLEVIKPEGKQARSSKEFEQYF